MPDKTDPSENTKPSEPDKKPFTWLTHVFIWLSGACAENLLHCSKAEQRKYVAFGATVLVPCIFGLITAAYAVSTLTTNMTVITAVAIVWSFVILAVDRALLSSYRAHQPFTSKIVQLALRLCIAVLMGVTISHPLTLLIFKDTISSIIEEGRDADIDAARTKFAGDKKDVEARIATLDAEIAATRKRWDDSFEAKFLAEPVAAPAGSNAGGTDPGARAELDNKIKVAQAPTLERQAAVEKEIGEIEAQRKSLQAEIDHWQAEFEREINGKRSGMTGVGPRAASIRDDQLSPRRAESQRLSASLDARTKERNDLRAEVASIAQSITAAEAAKANDLVSKQRSEQAKMSSLRQQIAEQQAGQFVELQTQNRESLKGQLDALLGQERLLRAELTQLVEESTARVNALRAEPRRDLLKQTLALHHLFNDGAKGGTFALAAYIVLTLLFMLVDTIPVIVKFFSKPGPYDDMLDQQEGGMGLHRQSSQRAKELANMAAHDEKKILRTNSALDERHRKENARFAEKVRLEREAIKAAREAGHHEDADHREMALDERVKLFYGYSSHAKQRFFHHAHGHASEDTQQAHSARSNDRARGPAPASPHAATEGNGNRTARPLNGHSNGHGSAKAHEEATDEPAGEIPTMASLAEIVFHNGHAIPDRPVAAKDEESAELGHPSNETPEGIKPSDQTAPATDPGIPQWQPASQGNYKETPRVSDAPIEQQIVPRWQPQTTCQEESVTAPTEIDTKGREVVEDIRAAKDESIRRLQSLQSRLNGRSAPLLSAASPEARGAL